MRTPAQHVVHHTHRLLVWLGGLAAVLILVAIGGIWRLLQGPIELDRLVPYVEEALNRSSAGIGIAISGVSIGLDQETHRLDLRAENVRLSLPNGERLANVPQMATSFSLGGLLGGRLEPTRLVVEHAVIALRRDENGAISFRVGNGDTAGSDDLALDNALAVFAPLRPDTPWSGLREISVRDATVLVDDRASGRVWRADRAAATLQRGEDGAEGSLAFAVALGGGTPELHASYRYSGRTQKLDLKFAADRVNPATLATLSPALAELAQAQFPVSGIADIRFDAARGVPEAARVDLDFGAGTIATDLLASGRAPVAHGELHADYAQETGELRLDKLALDLGGGTTLALTGRLDGLPPRVVTASTAPPRLAGSLAVTLSHVPTARLGDLWPRGVSPGGRRWIAANLPEGMLDELALQLAVKVDTATMAADFAEPRGTMRYHDLTVDYFNGLPPVKKVSGTATVDDRHIEFAVGGAALKSLKVTGGTVSISDIGAPVETLAVDVAVSGPLQDVLETIDAKPLHYAHEAGIDPARLGGKADAQLHFKLPLLASLKLDAVDYGAKATLSGVSYGKVALDRPLTEGALTLDLGHTGVHAQGSGKFDDVPATIDGNLYFHAKNGPRAHYRIGLTLDDEARRRLDWTIAGDRLSGPVGVDLNYTVANTGTRSDLDATLDLTGATLTLDEAGWKKPPRQPATAKIAVALNDEVVTAIPQLDIRAPGLDGRFAVGLNPTDRRVERVDIRRLVVADDDVAGTVSRSPNGGWRADIRGNRLDLHRLLKQSLNDDRPGSEEPLAIDAHLGRLVLGPRREVQDVSASLARDRGYWQTVRIDGRYVNGRRMALALGAQKLRFETDDLGASLALFGVADNVVGGKLTVDGTLGDENGHRVLRAHLDGSDYNLARAPVLARLLSLASLDGIAALMSGSGIPFTTLRGDIALSAGQIAIERLIAYGGALGITAQGRLSSRQDRIDVDGTLAPAYALNSVLGNFPVLGSILMGGEGQGLFAASFRLTGSSDDPSVSVNPLSALTPGLLRHLFDPLMTPAVAPAAAPVRSSQAQGEFHPDTAH
ncbi:MAG: hypothetical protein JO258_21360 [Alphaproteobacteria bacterium]|nr:hypothetical protein [Alphaproteobacteria bacterium]